MKYEEALCVVIFREISNKTEGGSPMVFYWETAHATAAERCVAALIVEGANY